METGSPSGNPTARRRRLGYQLRQLREAAGISVDDVAKRLECSRAKISRIEGGRVTVRPLELNAMLDMYHVDKTVQEQLSDLARAGRERGWWQNYGDTLPGRYFTHFLGLESAASLLRMYEDNVFPGLLQTKDYAYAVLKAFNFPEPNVEGRVSARLARQARLSGDDALELQVVIDEGALRRMVGGPVVMREQLQYIIAQAHRPNIRLQLVPFSQGSHPGIDGPFEILHFPDPVDPGVVFIEYMNGGFYLEKPNEIKTYVRAFEELSAEALSPNETIDLVAAAAAELQ